MTAALRMQLRNKEFMTQGDSGTHAASALFLNCRCWIFFSFYPYHCSYGGRAGGALRTMNNVET